ncbi:MAG TPA: Trm112 family protein [Acidimicrobiales bacterium]
MALEDFLLNLIEDPVDHGPLLYLDDANILYNPRRRVAYEVRDSIPVLLPDEATTVSDEDHDKYVNDPLARPTGTKA